MQSSEISIWLQYQSICAVCEGAERYSASVVATHEYTVSAACDLQCPHVAPDSIPRLSDSELALPGQYFRPFDSRAPIRWAWSFELTSREERLLPLNFRLIFCTRTPESFAAARRERRARAEEGERARHFFALSFSSCAWGR